MMKRLVAFGLAPACLGALVAFYGLPHSSGNAEHAHRGHHAMAALAQTLLVVDQRQPLRLPALAATDGNAFAADRLRGRWSIMFFGYTSCPDVCPTTLQVLGAVARDDSSGVSSGSTQIAFVSVDPERDTPQRIRGYLDNFSSRIVGISASREAVDRLSAEIGAAYQAQATGIDHSTSLFVIDPQGRLAGVLLRPDDPAKIVGDLKTLQSSYAHASHASLAH